MDKKSWFVFHATIKLTKRVESIPYILSYTLRANGTDGCCLQPTKQQERSEGEGGLAINYSDVCNKANLREEAIISFSTRFK